MTLFNNVSTALGHMQASTHTVAKTLYVGTEVLKCENEKHGKDMFSRQEAQLFAGIWPTVLPIADDLCKCCGAFI